MRLSQDLVTGIWGTSGCYRPKSLGPWHTPCFKPRESVKLSGCDLIWDFLLAGETRGKKEVFCFELFYFWILTLQVWNKLNLIKFCSF